VVIVIGIHRVKRKATAHIIHLAGVEVDRFFPSIFAAGALKTVWPFGPADFTESSVLAGT
jgi:hypothetical protein